MSDFVMGAEMRLTDNVSQTFSAITNSTNEFRSSVEPTERAVSSMATAVSSGTQDMQTFADTLTQTATATDSVVASAQQATQGTNTWKAAMQQFNRGTETLKNLPNTLKQIASQKLEGLQNSFISTRLQAGLLVGGIKTLAREKVTSLVDNFKEFKATVTEGKSGLSGFAAGLKNIGKISLANTFSTVKNLTTKVKEFAQTKISNITNGFKEFKSRVTQGQTGTSGLLTALKNVAQVSLTALHNGLSKVGSLATSAGSKIASGLGSAISGVTKGLGVGIAAAGAGMVALTVKALNLGGELEQNIGGSEAVFKEFAATMQETGKKAFSSMGLSQSDFLATSNKMGALFQGSGFGIKESADISAKSMQRAADVASIMGLDVNDAMEAVAGAAKGNFTMMDNLGIAMNDTSIAAYAASKGIKKTSQQMTQQEKVGLAMEMFLEKTSYAAGNYAKENDTLAGSLTTAKAAMSNFLAGSGSVDDLVNSFVNASTIIVEKVTEIVPRLATGVAEAIGAILPKVPGILVDTLPVLLNAATQMFQSLIKTVQQNKQPLIGLAVTIVSDLATFLLDAIPQIVLVGADILVGLVQGIAKQLPTIVPQAVKAIETLVNGLMANLDTIIIAGIDILNGLIDGLIQNLPLLLGTAMKLILSVVTGLLNNIQLIINCALNLVQALVTGLIQNIPMLLQGALQLIMGIVNGLVSNINLIIDGALALVNALIIGIVQNLPAIIQAAVQVVIALAIGLIQAIPQLIAAVPRLVSGIIDTILSTNWLEVGWEIVKGIGKGLWDGVKSIFGGGGKEGGEAAATGAAEGLTSNIGTISTASQTAANSITTGLQPDFTVINGYGVTATTGLATGITDSMGLTTDAATSTATAVTDTFKDINLYDCGTNAMQGFMDGINAMKSSVMEVANNIANSVKTTINGALDIHSPSRVMEETGEYTGEGLVVGITKMIDKVRSAAQGLSNSTVEPFATQSTSVQAISPSGVSQAPAGRREGLKIAIENIILQDVGNKDPKALVAEILQLLYDALSGADEVLSMGELGALL